MMTPSTMWGLFGVGCGLLVTVMVLCSVLGRKVGRTLLLVLLAVSAQAMLVLLLVARPGRIATVWQGVMPHFGSQGSLSELPADVHSDVHERSLAEVRLRGSHGNVVVGHRRAGSEWRIVEQSVALGDERRTLRATTRATAPEPPLPPVTVGTLDLETRQELPNRFYAKERKARVESRHGPLWTIMGGVAIAAFLGVGYVFLDAGTRGYYTWPLRFAALAAFAAICVAMAALRP